MDIEFWQIVFFLIIIAIVVWFRLAKKARTKEVEQYNKKHNKNIKTWEELDNYHQIEKEKLIEKEEKAKEEKKLVEKVDEVGDSLMSKVSRLKRLYNNGTLTKAEFEQAKNKLLK